MLKFMMYYTGPFYVVFVNAKDIQTTEIFVIVGQNTALNLYSIFFTCYSIFFWVLNLVQSHVPSVTWLAILFSYRYYLEWYFSDDKNFFEYFRNLDSLFLKESLFLLYLLLCWIKITGFCLGFRSYKFLLLLFFFLFIRLNETWELPASVSKMLWFLERRLFVGFSHKDGGCFPWECSYLFLLLDSEALRFDPAQWRSTFFMDNFSVSSDNLTDTHRVWNTLCYLSNYTNDIVLSFYLDKKSLVSGQSIFEGFRLFCKLQLLSIVV